ncbi:hypothetical protein ACN2XU_09610 [Primorskyibacter sp. 2E107]
MRADIDAPIAHKGLGLVPDFDRWKVGDNLDIASRDSDPLGFLEERRQGG